MKPISETDLEQLSAYIDGELSDSERRFFQKRLSNDAELRVYCERVWIAASVLKSQPFQLMPANSAELIGSQCTFSGNAWASPMRLIASFGALAIVLGLGFQLTKPSESPSNAMVQSVNSVPAINKTPVFVVPSPSAVPSQNTTSVVPALPAPNSPNSVETPINASVQIASQNDPAEFELNESTRSKTWPRSNQGMDDYLARHNQMTDANASNGLISYAEILTNQEPLPQEQAEK